MKKKGHPEQEAFRQFVKSKYFMKLSNDTKKLTEDPAIKDMMGKYPPLTEKQIIKSVESYDKKCNLIKTCDKSFEEYIKAWEDFMDERGIKLMIGNKPILKGVLQLSTNANFEPSITAISKNETGQDYLDHRPLFTLLKDKFLGKAQVTQGRSEDIERNKKIRKEYKASKKKSKSPNTIIDDLSKKYSLSPERIYQIMHSRRYDS